MKYNVKLESFEGPMDLLLHLIDKDKIDIYDIPISSITDQYLDYLYNSNYLDLDTASEFLLMAATLLQIKSKMLLPNSDSEEKQLTMDDITDPRAELIAKILEYKRFKIAAERLKAREIDVEFVFYKEPEELSFTEESQETTLEGLKIEDIIKAFNKVLGNSLDNENISIKEISRDEIPVSERMKEIRYLLYTKPVIKFNELFLPINSKSYVITTFLAILELIKMKRITIIQEDNYGDILIYNKGRAKDNNNDSN